MLSGISPMFHPLPCTALQLRRQLKYRSFGLAGQTIGQDFCQVLALVALYFIFRLSLLQFSVFSASLSWVLCVRQCLAKCWCSHFPDIRSSHTLFPYLCIALNPSAPPASPTAHFKALFHLILLG